MRSFRLIFPLAWRNLWRRGVRTLLTLAAVALAIASMIVLGSFLRAWGDSAFYRTVEALNGHGQIHNPSFLEDPTIEHSMPEPEGPLKEALSEPIVKAWAPRVVVQALIRSERETAPITLYGIDPEREAEVSFFRADIVEGTPLTADDSPGLIMGQLLADRLQVSLGRRVVISAQDRAGDIKEIGVRVIGFYREQPDLQKYAVFMSLKPAQEFLGLGGKISEIAFLARSRGEIEATANMLDAAAPDLEVLRWDQLQPFAKAVTLMVEQSNSIWVFVSFALVAFGLINTFMMVVFERMHEFGLMQALGMKPRLLLAQVLLESVYLVVLGTFAGVILGAEFINLFADGLDLGNLGAGAAMFGASQVLYPELDWGQIALASTLVVSLSILASLYPALQAAKRVPIDVLTRANN